MAAQTGLERLVCESVERRREDLVGLVRALVGFDTVTHTPGAPPRQEALLQELLAERLARPRRAGHRGGARGRAPRRAPLVPPGFTFSGRPQLVARFRGTGEGRTLLLNGHVDVVDVEPREAWSSNRFRAEVHDGACGGAARAT
ncbi:MAG: hypothetical protein M3P39_03405 [Actinomycetota bacterium]|nr:hypothetical protein [Actinomycetota bacterium]